MLKAKSGLMALVGLAMSGAAAMSNAGAKLQPTATRDRGVPMFKPYTDNVGMHHGSSGDKLARKAAKGTIGLRHGRGGLTAWASASAANAWRGHRKQRQHLR